jgi:hypothetical protein
MPGRVVIQFTGMDDLREKLTALSESLEINAERFSGEALQSLPRHSAGSEPERLKSRSVVASGTA